MNLIQKIKMRLVRFFDGRCGIDELGMALLISGFLFSSLSTLVSSAGICRALRVIHLALWTVMVLRMVSKNKSDRYIENYKFLCKWNPFKNMLTSYYSMLCDADHRYYRCSCGMWLRVPKGKGKIKVTCSRCGRQMIKKS